MVMLKELILKWLWIDRHEKWIQQLVHKLKLELEY